MQNAIVGFSPSIAHNSKVQNHSGRAPNPQQEKNKNINQLNNLQIYNNKSTSSMNNYSFHNKFHHEISNSNQQLQDTILDILWWSDARRGRTSMASNGTKVQGMHGLWWCPGGRRAWLVLPWPMAMSLMDHNGAMRQWVSCIFCEVAMASGYSQWSFDSFMGLWLFASLGSGGQGGGLGEEYKHVY